MEQPKPATNYCDYVLRPEAHPLHRQYHDFVYGFPVSDDDGLFQRLILEINQAGLSWETILRRQEEFVRAYEGFVVARVAAYGASDVERLMGDRGIIRNRKKIEAAIHNAGVILDIQAHHGSFGLWLDQRARLDRSEWVKEFRRAFRFTGPEITAEFLMSTGHLAGAHRPDCPIFRDIERRHPPFHRAQ